MKSVVVLLLLAGPVGAQTLAPSSVTSSTNTGGLTSTCFSDGEFWIETGPTCHANKALRQTVSGNAIVSLPGSTVVTNSPMPKCPDGYSLVLRSSGSPACAREIIDAQ